jgi:hypothetical protein
VVPVASGLTAPGLTLLAPTPCRELLLPNVLIPGVSHAGAARLAEDLGRHSQVCLPDVPRIGHFTPLRFGRSLDRPLDEYDRHFARWSGQRYRLEVGVDYFDGGPAMIRGIVESLPRAWVVLVLCDPVRRLWVGYRDKLLRGRVPSAMDFETYVERCLALRANGADLFEGNRHFRTFSGGFYFDFLPDWLEAFGNRARVIFTEDLRAEPDAQIEALLDWLGLEPSAVTGSDDNEESVAGYAEPEVLAASRARHWWPSALRRSPVAQRSPRSSDGHLRSSRQSERALTKVRGFYAAANRDLAELLRGRGYSGLPEWLDAV